MNQQHYLFFLRIDIMHDHNEFSLLQSFPLSSYSFVFLCQDPDPLALPMRIEAICPQVDKRSLPSGSDLHPVRIFTKATLQILKNDFMIPGRDMLITFVRIDALILAEEDHMDRMDTKGDQPKQAGGT